MALSSALLRKKPLIYALKILLGGLICWYGLLFLGVANPIWAVITVIIVSDPDVGAVKELARMRLINTLVGCITALIALVLFGYSTLVFFFTITLTVLIVTSIERYPANWRLAPATIVILMNASMNAQTRMEEVTLAFMRAGEIGVGCLVALGLAFIYRKMPRGMRKDSPLGED